MASTRAKRHVPRRQVLLVCDGAACVLALAGDLGVDFTPADLAAPDHIINPSDAALKVLSINTKNAPDIACTRTRSGL